MSDKPLCANPDSWPGDYATELSSTPARFRFLISNTTVCMRLILTMQNAHHGMTLKTNESELSVFTPDTDLPPYAALVDFYDFETLGRAQEPRRLSRLYVGRSRNEALGYVLEKHAFRGLLDHVPEFIATGFWREHGSFAPQVFVTAIPGVELKLLEEPDVTCACGVHWELGEGPVRKTWWPHSKHPPSPLCSSCMEKHVRAISNNTVRSRNAKF